MPALECRVRAACAGNHEVLASGPTTEAALRELLAKAIDATVTGDRMRALAALNQMHGLLEQQTVEREPKKSSKAPTPAKRKRHRCADCGYFFKWPGQLEDHRRERHPEVV